MDGKTDEEIFGGGTPDRVQNGDSKGGRPSVNRDLARRLFQGGFSTAQVAKHLKCHVNTVRKIRRELEESGELVKKDREPGLSIVQADFDDECVMAVGISFAEWLKTKTKSHKRIFVFCQKTWSDIWDRPSLVLVKNDENQLGDQLCLKFNNVFNDPTRSRNRKKLIRNLFRFLGRRDLCDRYLTMTASRDPRSIKRIPQISMMGFPAQVQSMFDEINEIDPEMGLACEFKLASMMRTGLRSEDRGLMGLKVGSGHPSFIIMDGPDDFRISVLEKMRETWDVTWLPRRVRERLWELYQRREKGEPLFRFKVREFRKLFGDMSENFLGIRLIPHDLRKISITWLYVNKIPLELAVEINVGWKDLSTAKDHYMHIRGLLKKTDRIKYRALIPDWFKEGLDEYEDE